MTRTGAPRDAMPARHLGWAGMVIASIAMASAVLVLRAEYEVWSYKEASDKDGLALQRGDHNALVVTPDPGAEAQPRTLLYHALTLARVAGAEPDPDRRRDLLSRARSAISLAEARRPNWGRARLVHAYISAMRNKGILDQDALCALSDSWRLTPYLADAGAWRIITGFANWDRLAPSARSHLVDEAVWLGRDSASLKPRVFEAARASAGYEAFSVHWVNDRQGDADIIMAHQGAAP